jgi:Ca2+-binding RTX toxin-like protein
VSDNEAVPGEAPGAGRGGGISALDTDLNSTVIAYNDAQDGGGLWWRGIQLFTGFTSVIYNHATGDGGGVLYNGGDSGFGRFTISGNRADGRGGGVFLSPAGFSELDGITIASNSAPTGNGGGIWHEGTPEGPRHTMAGVIVARNGGGDCAGPGTFDLRGGNLDGDGSCAFTGETDISGVDPVLGPPAYNGGATITRALLEGSPAIDRWPNCRQSIDQRGAARPQGAACDSGAFEVGNCCPAPEPPFKPGPTPPSGPRSYCGLLAYGTAGADVIKGDAGRNDIHGLAGNDRIFAGDNADCVYGGSGNDLLKGGHGHDAIYAKGGDDVLSGGDDEDLLLGYEGRDRLYGGADEDRLYGGPGGDYINGGGGYDLISAGPGDDVIDASGNGLDTVDCGSGVDRVKAKRLEHLYGCEHVKYVD